MKCTESPEESVLNLFCNEEITANISEWVTGLSVKLSRGISSCGGGAVQVMGQLAGCSIDYLSGCINKEII